MVDPNLTPNHRDILNLLTQSPNGIGIENLIAQVHESITHRSLQRLYRPLLTLLKNEQDKLYKNHIPVSEYSRDIVAYVRRPLGARQVVSELLRDLFIYAYERSTREYLEIHKTLVEPSPIRLRYRQFIFELIAHIIRDCIVDTMPEIERYTIEKIPENEKKAFIEIILDEIKRLHEGVLARYGLGPADLKAWLIARKNKGID